MRLATPIVLALDALEATALSLRELGVVRLADISPVHTKIDTMVPDKVLFFLLISRPHFSTLSPPVGG